MDRWNASFLLRLVNYFFPNYTFQNSSYLPSGTRVSPTTVTVARIAFTWSIEARIANGQTQDVTAETSMLFVKNDWK